ncbi:MAG TPA: polysaccharide deacetylase family protein [Tepidisphaeraceae bacterium]|nr:polysaccharide deacetylase family protein [Tepidisphaeraceae bacterium]
MAAGLTALYGTFVPQSGLWCRNISRGSRSGTKVALTFDDGPSPGGTDGVLDVLKREGIPAAFFVIGQNAAANPDLLRRIHSEGHLIGNHTYDHDHLSVFRGYRYWHDQLLRTDEVVQQITGVRPGLFRPPVGIKFIFTAAAAKRLNHPIVTWSRRALDGVDTSVDRILARLAQQTLPGDILTLHDGIDPHAPRKPDMTLEALPQLISRLRARGLQFVRLDELIGPPGGAAVRRCGASGVHA